VVDPCDGDVNGFLTEEDAYDEFQRQCGHDTFITHVKTSIALDEKEDFVLLGFSSGDLAAWKAADGCYKKRR
jgi:hypothetical protein